MKLTILVLIMVTFFMLARSAWASGFQVKTIGALNVDGVTLSHIWYSSGNINFTGIASAGTAVTATIDGASQTVTADANGNWVYQTTLSNTDHAISFSSSTGVVTFTLTVGEVPADVGALSPAQTPTAGTATPTVLLLLGGGVLIFGGFLSSRTR